MLKLYSAKGVQNATNAEHGMTFMVGFEPTTLQLTAARSNQLSYKTILINKRRKNVQLTQNETPNDLANLDIAQNGI